MNNFEVFQIRPTALEESPELNYDDPRDKSWPDLDEFDELITHLPFKNTPEYEFWTDTGEAPQYGFVMGDGFSGFMSERLYFEISKYSGDSFQFLPVKLDGEPFYIPVRWKPLDCLDLSRSEVRYYKHAPEQVMHIDKFVFHSDRLCDPLVCEWHSKSAARGQGFGARIVQRAGA